MAASHGITRRHFLGLSAVVSTPFGGLRTQFLKVDIQSSLDAQLRQFASRLVRTTFRETASAARVGAAHLRKVPTDCDLASLLSALSIETPSLVGMASRGEEDNLRKTLHGAISRDFEYGRVVSIDGWVIARTEVRLSVLARILSH